MRISGGAARGTVLVVPKGDAVRPATDGMRQAVFSSLGARVVGARFADLFAGSGGYGLEAWSRGAAGGVFVEQNAKAAACLRQNMLTVAKSARREAGELRLVSGDALTWRPAVGAADRAAAAGTGRADTGGEAAPDLVFVDPPYPIIQDVAPRLFAGLREVTAGAEDPIVVFEYPGELELLPEGWTLVKRIGRGARQPTVGFFRLV
jgi:16S rRNA (guanine966-N2)-methyltransferase